MTDLSSLHHSNPHDICKSYSIVLDWHVLVLFAKCPTWSDTFYLETTIVKGQVTRRVDDPFGQGFGHVKTGFVSSQKLSILQQAAAERSAAGADFRMELSGANSSLSNDSRARGLRVTWAESPAGSRPGSNMGWTEKVVEMDAASLRAQTPPLAGEWAGAVKSAAEMRSSLNQSSSASFASSSQSSVSGQFQPQPPPQQQQNQAMANINNGNSNGNAMMMMSKQQQAASQNSQMMQKKTSSQMSMQKSSFSSSMQQSSSSAFSSNFNSSSSNFQSSSSFQTGSVKSQHFEAFPGMGGIENMNLDAEKAGNN